MESSFFSRAQFCYAWQFILILRVAWRKIFRAPLFKRLRLGKTTGWQHRFFDLTILSPIWLGTYEYMKSSLENFFFRFETGLPEWIFQIWSKIFKSDQVFVYTKKSLFWAFWGPAKVIRPLDITKAGAESEKPPKNWNGRSGRPKLHRTNFRPKNWRNRPFCIFFLPEPRKTNFCSSETKY